MSFRSSKKCSFINIFLGRSSFAMYFSNSSSFETFSGPMCPSFESVALCNLSLFSRSFTRSSSPIWRKDYAYLSRFRMRLYIRFMLWKLRYHPLKLLRQPFNFLRRRFETKMEMVPYRALVLKFISMRS